MKKKRKFTSKQILLSLFAVVCAARAIISLIMILSMLSKYTEGTEVYENLNQYITTPSADPNPQILPDSEPDTWPVVDFDALRAVNPDIVAWLICEGTNINHPVVQGTDNIYYLKHLFDGKRNDAGCLFVDCSNAPDFTDRNTIIYGHHMKDKSMFSMLTDYKRQSFYEEHTQMLLLTPEGNYRIELFAGFVSSTQEKNWEIWFGSDAEFLDWVSQIKEKSTFQSNVEISEWDKLVTLSTCSYEFNDARYIVVGKLTQ